MNLNVHIDIQWDLSHPSYLIVDYTAINVINIINIINIIADFVLYQTGGKYTRLESEKSDPHN